VPLNLYANFNPQKQKQKNPIDYEDETRAEWGKEDGLMEVSAHIGKH
jgi:hypothetical protein